MSAAIQAFTFSRMFPYLFTTDKTTKKNIANKLLAAILYNRSLGFLGGQSMGFGIIFMSHFMLVYVHACVRDFAETTAFRSRT